MTRADSIDDLLGRIMQALESALLAVLLLALVVVGVTQMVAERVAGVSIVWTGDVMAALFLWLLMAGSMVAAGRLKHVRIRLVERALPASMLIVLHRFVYLFSALICLLLTWHGLKVVAMEYEFRQVAFGPVPNWVVIMAMPVAFGIMGARFAAWGLILPRTAPASAE